MQIIRKEALVSYTCNGFDVCQTIKEMAYKVKQVVIENIKYMYKISRKVTIY